MTKQQKAMMVIIPWAPTEGPALHLKHFTSVLMLIQAGGTSSIDRWENNAEVKRPEQGLRARKL